MNIIPQKSKPKNKFFPAAIISFAALFLFTSCSGSLGSSSSANYIYSYALEQTNKPEQLIFRDKYIAIQFFFDASAISFQLQNVSEATMSIVWEKVSLGVNKRIYAVKNNTTLYSTSAAPPPTIAIPPLGYIRDLIIPRDFVYFENNKWMEKEFFITNDKGSPKLKKAITAVVGNEITLTLPLKIGEIVVEYPFVFKVSKVTPLPSNLLPPVKERPVAPKIPVQEAGIGQTVIPIFIAAGVLGIAAYLLSQKKTPAIE